MEATLRAIFSLVESSANQTSVCGNHYSSHHRPEPQDGLGAFQHNTGANFGRQQKDPETQASEARKIMNVTFPAAELAAEQAPMVSLFTDEVVRAFFWMLVPTEVFYFSLYFKVQGREKAYKRLTALCMVLFLISPIVTPMSCALVRSVQYFFSMEPS